MLLNSLSMLNEINDQESKSIAQRSASQKYAGLSINPAFDDKSSLAVYVKALDYVLLKVKEAAKLSKIKDPLQMPRFVHVLGEAEAVISAFLNSMGSIQHDMDVKLIEVLYYKFFIIKSHISTFSAIQDEQCANQLIEACLAIKQFFNFLEGNQELQIKKTLDNDEEISVGESSKGIITNA